MTQLTRTYFDDDIQPVVLLEGDMDRLEFRIERLLLKNGNLVNNIRDHDLKNDDMTSSQSEAILFYAGHSGSSIKDLAVHLNISHQAARKLVDKLKEKHILAIQVSQEDKRYTNVDLTAEGQKISRRLKNNGFSVGEKCWMVSRRRRNVCF